MLATYQIGGFLMQNLLSIILLLMLLSANAVNAQQAAPPPGPALLQYKQDRTEPTAQSKPDERGTSDSPLIVKIAPTEKTATERAQQQKDALEKANTEWWTIALTKALVVLAAAQFFAFLIFAYFLSAQGKALRDAVGLTRETASRQERDTQDLVAAMRANAAAAEQQGRSIQALRILTGAQYQSIDLQAKSTNLIAIAARKTADIAERALLELEAPLLFASILDPGIRMIPAGGDSKELVRDVLNTRRLEIGFTDLSFLFTNFGRTPAELISYFEDLYVVAAGDVPPPLMPAQTEASLLPPGTFIMPNGGRSEQRHRPLASLAAKWGNYDPLRNRLFWMGFVRYRDLFGNRYVSGFCNMFFFEENRYVLAGGDEFNYRRAEAQLQG